MNWQKNGFIQRSRKKKPARILSRHSYLPGCKTIRLSILSGITLFEDRVDY
jgi:hypothetical protein